MSYQRLVSPGPSPTRRQLCDAADSSSLKRNFNSSEVKMVALILVSYGIHKLEYLNLVENWRLVLCDTNHWDY